MKKVLFVLLLMATSAVVYGADPEAGKAKAATCQACHGANGVSNNPIWPNLAGQKDAYLVAQIKAFRDGERKNAMMAPMVTGLSDEDIDNLAAYYSALSCQ